MFDKLQAEIYAYNDSCGAQGGKAKFRYFKEQNIIMILTTVTLIE